MRQFTPFIDLRTLFVLDDAGRILSTREPGASPGPLFHLIRSRRACAWAAHAQVRPEVASELDRLAQQEPPARDFRGLPVHADRYVGLTGGRVDAGPVFLFPENLPRESGVVLLADEVPLRACFSGWTAEEVGGRSPILAVLENGRAVSVCFCARRSAAAAEAGVETAVECRGRGLGWRVAASWALAVRACGRLPLYSTSWSNAASLGLARRLGLRTCAGYFSVRR
jgi:hypothetical protein